MRGRWRMYTTVPAFFPQFGSMSTQPHLGFVLNYPPSRPVSTMGPYPRRPSIFLRPRQARRSHIESAKKKGSTRKSDDEVKTKPHWGRKKKGDGTSEDRVNRGRHTEKFIVPPHAISRAAQNPSTNTTKMEKTERDAIKRRTRRGRIKV